MLTVLGRELSLPNLSTAVDKNLYIDIDKKPFTELFGLPTTNTYIISNRTLEDLEEIILAGYFNIALVARPSQITQNFISNFISTDYYDNNLKIVSARVTQLYTKAGSETQQLLTALIALRDDDVNTFVSTMSTGLIPIINALTSITSMISYCKSISSSDTYLTELAQKASQLEIAQRDAEKYKSLYESLQSASKFDMSDKQGLLDQIRDLSEQLNSRTITSEELHNHAEYKALQAQYEEVQNQLAQCKQEFEAYKTNIEEQSELLHNVSQNSLVQHLRDEIKKLQMMPYDELLCSRLPVLQDATTLAAEHIIYFKEVRPTVYINSAIQWISSFLHIRYAVAQEKKCLILVFDPLIDQYTAAKYRKHGWTVDSKPNPANGVLITKCFDFSKLKTQYHIEDYNCIICIDRIHVNKDAINMKRCKKYYFINTTNDMTDFNLDRAQCIGFFEQVPPDTQVPKYRIKPWSEALCKTADLSRSGKFTTDGVFADIFLECGVISSK